MELERLENVIGNIGRWVEDGLSPTQASQISFLAHQHHTLQFTNTHILNGICQNTFLST